LKRVFSKDESFIKLFLFTLAGLALFLAPACLIWIPKNSFLVSRVLYLALFPLSLLCPLVLLFENDKLDSKPVYWFRFCSQLALALVLSVFSLSSYWYQQRWLSATQAYSLFRIELKKQLENLSANQKLVLLGAPTELEGLPLLSHFFILQDCLQQPFETNSSWTRMFSLSPDFFANRNLVNSSQIQRCLSDSNVITYGFVESANKLSIEPLDLELKPSKKANFAAIKTSWQQQGLKDGKYYSYARLPDIVSGKQYTFLKVKFRTAMIRDTQMRLLWKTPEMKIFDQSKHWLFTVPKGSESFQLHAGEILSYLDCEHIDALELEYDEGAEPDSLLLETGDAYKSAFDADPVECVEEHDSVLRAKNGKFRFRYDVSRVSKARSILVEISKPGIRFSFASNRILDDRKSFLPIETFYVEGKSGDFSLSDRLGSSFWHQIRIFPVDEQKHICGFSSDPLFIQSVDDKRQQAGAFLLPYNERQQ
jgi:hypothetical protein